MKRPIKFRYTDADGKPAYKEIDLPPDAVQLVGYDCRGKEVYEGDAITSMFDEEECSASMAWIYAVKNFVLKEKSE